MLPTQATLYKLVVLFPMELRFQLSSVTNHVAGHGTSGTAHLCQRVFMGVLTASWHFSTDYVSLILSSFTGHGSTPGRPRNLQQFSIVQEPHLSCRRHARP